MAFSLSPSCAPPPFPWDRIWLLAYMLSKAFHCVRVCICLAYKVIDSVKATWKYSSMNEPCIFCSDAISWILATPRPAWLWYSPDWGDREWKKKWQMEKLALGVSYMWWRCTSSIKTQHIGWAECRVGLKDLCSEALSGFLRKRKLWLVLSGNTGNTVSICTQTKQKLCHFP